VHQGLHGGGHGEGKKLREAARLHARGDLFSETEDAKDRAQLDEALAAFGLELEGAPPPGSGEHPFYLWPEHLDAWRAFCDVRTQWRHGWNGRTGLDYAAVLAHLRDGLALSPRKTRALYAQIRALEAGALAGDAELREESERGLGSGR
jgi:hypothetical protein